MIAISLSLGVSGSGPKSAGMRLLLVDRAIVQRESMRLLSKAAGNVLALQRLCRILALSWSLLWPASKQQDGGMKSPHRSDSTAGRDGPDRSRSACSHPDNEGLGCDGGHTMRQQDTGQMTLCSLRRGERYLKLRSSNQTPSEAAMSFLAKVGGGTPQRVLTQSRLSSSCRSQRVLVVASIPEDRALISRVLTETGLNVTMVADAGQGEEVLDALDPHLVVTDADIHTPASLWLVHSLRRKGRRLPIVAVLNGPSKWVSARAARRFGANRILSKPIRFENLVEAATTLLEAGT